METFQQFLPLALISILLMFICRSIAKEKGKDITLWTILGLIPAVNFYSLLYLLGAPSKILEGKMDRILNLLQNQQHNLKIEKNRKEDILEAEEEI
jgi:hypothetical protein